MQAFRDMDILVLKAVEGQLLNNMYIIGQNGAALGRHSASNDIVISESFVSRRHCEIKYVPEDTDD
jgi:pSer/pThr/pTyr-binding forkhead associated (FHA) protein